MQYNIIFKRLLEEHWKHEGILQLKQFIEGHIFRFFEFLYNFQVARILLWKETRERVLTKSVFFINSTSKLYQNKKG